jgi:hypothetical protein
MVSTWWYAAALLLVSAVAQGWEYRLVKFPETFGIENVGRLEARFNGSSPWGAFCLFEFDTLLATVACRSLGLPSQAPRYGAPSAYYSYADSEKPYLPPSDHRLAFPTRLRCQGNESRMEDCSAIGGNISCGASYTIFLDCPNIQNATEQNATMWEYRLADGASSVVGRVQARPTPNASWGTVCGGLPAYSTAAVACRSLSLADHEANYYHVRGTGPFPSAAQPIYFNDAGCVGSELSFDRCRLSAQPPAYCTHVDDLIATCEPNSGSWFYRTAGDNATVAVRNFTLIETRPASTPGQWGRLCVAREGVNAMAAVACRSLGLSAVGARGAIRVDSNVRIMTAQPLYLADRHCVGTEASVDQCAKDVTHPRECSPSDALYVLCPHGTVNTTTLTNVCPPTAFTPHEVRSPDDAYAPSACPVFGNCGATFCECVGAGVNNTDALSCLKFATSDCPTTRVCLRAYTMCLDGMHSLRDAADPTCVDAANTIYSAKISTSIAGSYEGSSLQQSCQKALCRVTSAGVAPGVSECSLSVDASSICGAVPFNAFAEAGPACAARVACDTQFCACLGSNGESNATKCVARVNSSTECFKLTEYYRPDGCMYPYVQCLTGLRLLNGSTQNGTDCRQAGDAIASVLQASFELNETVSDDAVYRSWVFKPESTFSHQCRNYVATLQRATPVLCYAYGADEAMCVPTISNHPALPEDRKCNDPNPTVENALVVVARSSCRLEGRSHMACAAQLCNCTANSTSSANESSSVTRCLETSIVDCEGTERCLEQYVRCVADLRYLNESSDSNCSAIGHALDGAIRTEFDVQTLPNCSSCQTWISRVNSSWQQACRSFACHLFRHSNVSCAGAWSTHQVCELPLSYADPLPPPLTRPPPLTLPLPDEVQCTIYEPVNATSSPITNSSSCLDRSACDRRFCDCVGLRNSTHATMCLAASNLSCVSVEQCLQQHMVCIANLSLLAGRERPGNVSDCAPASAQMKELVGSAFFHRTTRYLYYNASVSVYQWINRTTAEYNQSSPWARGCESFVCDMLHVTQRRCPASASISTTLVCTLPIRPFAGVSIDEPVQIPDSPPVTETPPATALEIIFRGIVRVNGTAFGEILDSPELRSRLQISLGLDLAMALGVPSNYMIIQDMHGEQQSLVATYGVFDGSGIDIGTLQSNAEAAASSDTWLTNVRADYQLVSEENPTVGGLNVTQVARTTPPPSTSRPRPSTIVEPSSAAMSMTLIFTFAGIVACSAVIHLFT